MNFFMVWCIVDMNFCLMCGIRCRDRWCERCLSIGDSVGEVFDDLRGGWWCSKLDMVLCWWIWCWCCVVIGVKFGWWYCFDVWGWWRCWVFICEGEFRRCRRVWRRRVSSGRGGRCWGDVWWVWGRICWFCMLWEICVWWWRVWWWVILCCCWWMLWWRRFWIRRRWASAKSSSRWYFWDVWCCVEVLCCLWMFECLLEVCGVWWCILRFWMRILDYKFVLSTRDCFNRRFVTTTVNCFCFLCLYFWEGVLSVWCCV